MQKINFENLPSTDTPINASNLNTLQNNVENAFKNEYSKSQTETYCCDYLNGLHTYSTEERVVGTYFGKPLYRKTIIYNTISNNDNLSNFVAIAHGILNIDTIFTIFDKSMVVRNNGVKLNYNFNPLVQQPTNYADYITSFSSDYLHVYFYVGRSNFLLGEPMDTYITIEYTKTTDVATISEET